MQLFRKNIWLLFYTVFISSMLLLAVLSFMRWDGLIQHYQNNQENLLKQWFGGFSSLLEQQENIITLVGQEIALSEHALVKPVQQQFDELIGLNPEFFSGFALISPSGEVLEYSSNLAQAKIPNLLELPQTRDSFEYTLHSDKMILGRTYPAPRLVIPARKAIKDADGKVIAVMTGALRLKGNSGFFALNSVLGEFNRITVLRSRDRYIQYATDGEPIDGFHSNPVSDAEYQNLLDAFSRALPYSLEEAMRQQQVIAFERETNDHRGHVLGTALYNPRYEFWLISEIEESYLTNQFLRAFMEYVVVLVIFQLFMFFLIRYIDQVVKRRRVELEFQANHDPLTKLPNRNFLLQLFNDLQKKSKEFSVLYIDLDSFKGINDSFGHSIGDRLLIELAKRLKSMLKPDQLLIRHGGDEFVLISSFDDTQANELYLCAKIYEACRDIQLDQMSFSPGCSIGVARYPEHGTELDELLRAADIAMYEAKKERNSMRLYQPKLLDHYLRLGKVEQLLRGAVQRNEISMNYQPQFDKFGRLHGVESLVRWNNPELGFVSPEEFIRVAEATNQMPTLGHFIIESSLQQIAELYIKSSRHFSLSINISVRQLDESFAHKLILAAQKSGFEPSHLTIEITENHLIEDLDSVKQQLTELQAAGIKVSLDDFGTGYSSLSVLSHLQPNEIKIDKSFVDNILNEKTALKMAENIIAIGHNYGSTVLAEGVETAEQFECLKAAGCDLFQGYYFSRPLSQEALETFLLKDT